MLAFIQADPFVYFFPFSFLLMLINMHSLQKCGVVFVNVWDAQDIVDVVHCSSLYNADAVQ